MPQDKPSALLIHKSVLMKCNALNPATYNPNKMAPEKYEALKESIRKHGFLDPLVVQKEGLNIIGGHHRQRAIKEIAVEDGIAIPDIPCIVIDVDDVTARKLNLKLNGLRGEPDPHLMGELLLDIFPKEERHDFGAEMALLGLEEDEGLKYIRLIEPDVALARDPQTSAASSGHVTGFGRSITLSLEFTTTAVRDQIKALLQERVELEGKKAGDIVAACLIAPKAATVAKAKKKKAAS